MKSNPFSPTPAIRQVRQLSKSQPTLEGAGVHLKRAFGSAELPRFDPFLLLDDFRADQPAHYRAGFPWHPHRGIETITYVLAGDVEHGDSLGNHGAIGAGDVQWMTAGSGIIHQEMPKGDAAGKMYGFQLWANLPARQKMMEPRYRDVASAQIPSITQPDGTTLKIIAGTVAGVQGPVRDIVIDPEYLDVTVPPHTVFRHATKRGHTVFAYVIGGCGSFGGGAHGVDRQREACSDNGTLVLFGDGDEILASTGAESVRFLLISGQPLGEPIAWAGPIVMNTQAELQTAFEEYEQGTFIKHRK